MQIKLSRHCEAPKYIATSSVTVSTRSTPAQWRPGEGPHTWGLQTTDHHHKHHLTHIHALPSLHMYTLVRSCHVWNQGQSERRSRTFCVFRPMIIFCTLQMAQVLYTFVGVVFPQMYVKELTTYSKKLVDEPITIHCIFILSWINSCLNQRFCSQKSSDFRMVDLNTQIMILGDITSSST